MSENENMGQNPRVFISYSWDSPEHKLWVESFAQELRKSGIDARLDAWRDESQSIDDFMMVELERADFILAVCTPQFKQKIVENAEGTATASGFEIGTAAALRRMGGKDVIPVLKQGEWTEAAPSSLLSFRFYDFTKSDVSEEFTQLRDRLLGHIRRPPELGKASGPAAGPELPDIFSEGSSPKPQPKAPPPAASGSVARAAPPMQEAQPVVSAPHRVGYSKGKVWGTVGAILLGLVVLWNLIPDVEEPLDNAPESFSSTDGSDVGTAGASDSRGMPAGQPVEDYSVQGGTEITVPADDEDIDWEAMAASLAETTQDDIQSSADPWMFVAEGGNCGVLREVATDSWVQILYHADRSVFGIGTYDHQLGAVGVEQDQMYEIVYQFDEEYGSAFIADVVGDIDAGIPGVYTELSDPEFVENLGIYNALYLFANEDPYTDNMIVGFSLSGSGQAADQLLTCVRNL